MTGKAFKWMESYLSNQYQRVVVDGEKSEPVRSICGLPHGATLAAKGYNLYTKLLGDIIQKHIIPHFIRHMQMIPSFIFRSKQKVK